MGQWQDNGMRGRWTLDASTTCMKYPSTDFFASNMNIIKITKIFLRTGLKNYVKDDYISTTESINASGDFNFDDGGAVLQKAERGMQCKVCLASLPSC